MWRWPIFLRQRCTAVHVRTGAAGSACNIMLHWPSRAYQAGKEFRRYSRKCLHRGETYETILLTCRQSRHGGIFDNRIRQERGGHTHAAWCGWACSPHGECNIMLHLTE